MYFRLKIAMGAGRLAGFISRVSRAGGGTSLPGAVALKIDPDIIKELACRLDLGSIIITATNGKTTTTNMVAKILTKAKLAPVHNAAGANLDFGIATALMRGRSRTTAKRIGLFEVDEATVTNVVPQLRPEILAVGNIFRDQLDRFGEVDQTARLIAKGIKGLKPDAGLVLNADDPRVAALGQDMKEKPLYFGIDDERFAKDGTLGAQDSKDCLVCGGPLTYSRQYFSHLGHYSCRVCGFKRPEAQIIAKDLDLNLKGSRFTLVTPKGEFKIELAVPALYNIYNALLAASVAIAVGVEPAEAAAALGEFRPTFGRFEIIKVADRKINLMLIKNPTGFNQAIDALNMDSEPKNIMIAINDNLADGTDVSWLWDADLENLGSAKWLMVGGIRAYDMAVRLKYAGLNQNELHVESEFAPAIDKAIKATPKGSDLYILPTYTAMLEIRRHLERLGGIPAFWQSEAG